MTGAFLIGFAVLTLLALILWKVDDYNEDVWGTIAVVCGIITICLVVAIPCSRIGTKVDAAYAKDFQQTLDHNRTIQGDFTVLERTAVIDEINSCNRHIRSWQIKGQKWYYNKWYLHPDTQNAVLIK